MPQFGRLPFRFPRPGLSFVMLIMLLAVLLIVGGASMSYVSGQLIARTVSVLLLIAAIVFGPRLAVADHGPVWVVLGAAILLVLIQLVPLPPAWWQALPGRALFAEAALASGQPQPWRPLAIVPGDAVNAAASLIVPLTVLVLVSGLRRHERAALPGLLLAVTVAAMLVGLLQFTGADLTNPFVNSEPGGVDGLFANRNHFALFLSIGCVAAPAWAFGERVDTARHVRPRARWRGPFAFAMIVLFALVILASGSRAAILLGMLGIGGGLLLARRGISRDLRHYPRWVAPMMIAIVVGALALFVLVSVMAGRAVSIDRVLAIDTAQDLRARNLPVVLAMVRDYFPFGSGYGGFDPLFRIHEPMTSLLPNYFNHAHNDFVEIVLDGGLAGLVLLTGALVWGTWASVDAWRSTAARPDAESSGAARMGSVILVLVVVASLVDYPARTPMIMAVVVIAGICLCRRPKLAALPASDQSL